MRHAVSVVSYPLRVIANFPVSFFHKVTEQLVTRRDLLLENMQLKEEKRLLMVKTQQLSFLEQQNAELRTLLGLTQRVTNKYISAEIMAVRTTDSGQQVMIDKGKSSGVYVGQPVVDEYGVIGQVVMVEALSSRVMLITDGSSAVPVINLRTGMRFIAMGTNSPNALDLAYVSDTTDVRQGDVLVTSGIGLGLPAGYAVGAINSVSHTAGERFAKVVVIPYAHVNSSRYVLVLWSKGTANDTKNANRSGSKSGGKNNKLDISSVSSSKSTSKKHSFK